MHCSYSWSLACNSHRNEASICHHDHGHKSSAAVIRIKLTKRYETTTALQAFTISISSAGTNVSVNAQQQARQETLIVRYSSTA